MWSNKFKGFSLIEIIIIVAIVSVILAIAAPTLTKKMKMSQNSGCVGGSRAVKKVFTDNGSFTVPDNITGDITVTMVGGGGEGGAGYRGAIETKTEIMNSNGSVELSQINDSNKSTFYSNIFFHAVSAGEAASCDSKAGRAGNSGEYYYANNISIARGKKVSFNYDSSNRAWSASIADTEQQGSSETLSLTSLGEVAGDVGQDGSPAFLRGGVPRGMIDKLSAMMSLNKMAAYPGIGESCIWNGSQYSKDIKYGSSSAAYQYSYRIIYPSLGGGAGAYANFNINLDKNTQCNIVIGRGGQHNYDETEGRGGDTSLTCNDVNYVVGGGRGAYEGSGSGGSSFTNMPGGAKKFNGGSGSTPSVGSGISGGNGGDVMKGDGVVYSKGGTGGCPGALKTAECLNPNGSDGVSPSSDLRRAGSGGGGASCNEDTCGLGGAGADGVVILEYKTRCY